MARVYVSLPPSAPGREVLRGAQVALEVSGADVELVRGSAEQAAADPRALAYLGDFHSRDVAAGQAVLGAAGLLQVAPVATWTGLGGPTLVRIMPHDGAGARAIAAWLAEQGIAALLVVHDHDDGYGVPVGVLCADAARERGLAVRARPVWDHDEPPEADLGDAGAVLYVGVAGSGAVALWRTLHAARPELWLLGSEGVARAGFARDLPPAPAARTRLFVAPRMPLACYGHEAMALILDALAQGGTDREAVTAAARATRDRASVLGRYSLDADGHTTTEAYGRLVVLDGGLAYDV